MKFLLDVNTKSTYEEEKVSNICVDPLIIKTRYRYFAIASPSNV